MRLSLTLALGLVAAGPLFADNWPQWRGPKNDGHSAETGLPAEFGPEKNLVWKAKLPGPGESSPVVWDDKVFLTAVTGDDVVLLCLGTDGQEKWRKPLATTGKERSGPDQATSASASPTTDGKHVWAYAGGMKGGQLKCFDLAGNLAWEKNLQSFGKYNIQFGTHWTPVLYKGKLYLQVLHRTAQKLVKLDAATGDQEWAVDRRGAVPARDVPSRSPESPDVYASAFIWEGEGGPLLISHGNDFCTAHKLDGAEVWRVMGLNPTNDTHWRFVSSPLVTPGLIVVPSCKNGPTVGVNPVGAKGEIDKKNPAELWRVNFTPDVVSPLLIDDIVYLIGDGPLTAVEAKTGKQIYKYSLTPGRHRSNMVYADGKIYVAGRDGAVDVVRPGSEFKVLANNKIPDTLYGSPAVAGGRLYFRGYENLWAVGTK
jgi:outer membrane protein assembly factor BamB